MPGGGPIRLLVIDDRAGEATALGARLAAVPDCEVVGSLGATEVWPEALSVPDLVLVDGPTLERRSGAGLLGPLRAAWPGLRVLVLACANDDDEQLAAAAAGAVGCVPRALPAGELAEAARRVHGGEVLFRQRVLLQLIRDGAPLARQLLPRPARPLLSEREREALEAAAEGLAAAEAAERMMISLHTVRTHLRNAVAKLEARSTTHAVARAMRAGLIDPDA